MNPQVENAKTEAKTKSPEYPAHDRLIAVSFYNSIPFAGETTGCQIGRNCDSIVPARVESDGRAVATDNGQTSIGLLIRRKVHSTINNQRYVDQIFVPWANVRGLQYGAPV